MTEHAIAAAKIIKQRVPNFVPKIGIVLGSGLGPLAEKITDATIISYSELPGFPCSGNVAGHAGKLHLGMLQGQPVACLQGRAHSYEGNTTIIKTIIRTLKLLGCETLLMTNAAGSLRHEVGVGELMLINDHINYQFTNPLIGPNEDEFGPRFVSMENAYDSELRAKFSKAAEKIGIKLAQGVYFATSGPAFETPAEIAAFRTLGADAVGMSTVADNIVARHCGMKVAAISAITNLAAGMHPEALSHEQTLQGAELAVEKMQKLFLQMLADY
ncbi:MAG: purine-nucleoside phosphorylase [Gammaproteobacteria bacterium]|nr:purine-nucleoside phosphorylase [Gammaproteobacteria bacterium]